MIAESIASKEEVEGQIGANLSQQSSSSDRNKSMRTSPCDERETTKFCQVDGKLLGSVQEVG